MEIYDEILNQSPLFVGITREETALILQCLTARTRQYSRGAFLFHAGDPIREAGIVLSGTLTILKEDRWGNRTILSQAAAGQLFGEVYACLPREPAQVSVLASEDALVLFLDIQKMLTTCPNACPFHTLLIQNLLSVIARRALELTGKMEHLSRRTTREKLLSYLSDQAQRSGCDSFVIPFTRQQLADYLTVDRSAMSHELCKMRDEGILTFHKNRFALLTKSAPHLS